ncbi:hypothetical protein BTN49_3200 [Candidatus Enterovibrio escicola]|uniref:Uncharacterized protein n=1 Tax=Candidatus Enterovibrio escicola TaxID=1927127 RepID=A0A2A5SZK1_9GAMM|nr:hypothetical protein BTN49_3200 [Candidatus Enterovibrio escacola]
MLYDSVDLHPDGDSNINKKIARVESYLIQILEKIRFEAQNTLQE